MSLWHLWDLSLDLLGCQRSVWHLLGPKDLQRFQVSSHPWDAGSRHHPWWQTRDWRTKIPFGVILITPGRRPHPLCSRRQNILILTYSAVAWTAGTVPALCDLSRQATRVFAAHFLRSLSQPDTRSRDASQSSINVLHRLREENMLSQPCRLFRRWDTLSSYWKSPWSRRSVWLSVSFLPPSFYCVLFLPAAHPAAFQVSYRPVLRRGIALMLQTWFILFPRKTSSFHRYWRRKALI